MANILEKLDRSSEAWLKEMDKNVQSPFKLIITGVVFSDEKSASEEEEKAKRVASDESAKPNQKTDKNIAAAVLLRLTNILR